MSTAATGNTKIHSRWASGNLYFYESAVGRTATGDVLQIGTGAVTIGGTAQDVDLAFYATGSISAIIDAGAGTFTTAGIAITSDGVLTVSNATEATSTTAAALVVSGGIANAKDCYFGDDVFLTSGAVLNWNAGDVTMTHSTGSLAVATTWATPAATGRPFLVTLTTDVALGGWSNAIKGYVVYGASGRTTGLGSAVNSEILLSAGTTSGTYAPLESEVVLGAGASIGTATSFLYCNVVDDSATFNTGGYLLELGAGVVDTTSGLFDVATITPTSVEFDARLRIRIGGVDYFIPLSADAAFE